ncbi:MAG: hypothetical protein ACM31O_18965 [Bacteroidota bacterium]|jgi:hypothetical protein
MIWTFKIFAVPVLVALATLAIRRWGAAVGGLLMGLPIMTGPISLLLALEQGTAFAATTTVGIILAVGAMGPYALVSYWTAGRLPWPLCMAAALAAFAVAALGLQNLPVDHRQASAVAASSMLLALVAMPRVRKIADMRSPPWWDIPLRMLVTAVLVVTVTFLASDLGPRLSGIMSTLPIISTVVVSFTLHQAGAAAGRAVIRANSIAMLSFIAFFLVVGETIEASGIAAAYTLALVVTAASSLAIMLLDRYLGSHIESGSASITKALE